MMSRNLKIAACILASLVIGLTATAGTADAAVWSAHARAATVNPWVGPTRAYAHGGATVARATPYRPFAGPTVAHASRTGYVRHW